MAILPGDPISTARNFFDRGPQSQARYLGLDGRTYDTPEQLATANLLFNATRNVAQASAKRMPARTNGRSGRSTPMPSTAGGPATGWSGASGKISSRGSSAPAPQRQMQVLVDANGIAPPIVLGELPQSGMSRGSPSASMQQVQQNRWDASNPTSSSMQTIPVIGGQDMQQIPVTSPQEQARQAALDALRQQYQANPFQLSYTPGGPDDPYMPGGASAQYAARGYAGNPYQSSQVFGGGNVGSDGSFSPGSTPVSGPTPPGQQYTAPAIAAYVLNAWQDPNLQGNMTPENVQFLAGLR